MFKSLCRLIFRKMGWQVEMTVPYRDKCIICVAPHTSNWDFIIAELYYHSIGRTAGFLMKKEWFFWPMGVLFRSMGGIPVERSRHVSLTDRVAEAAIKAERFELAVTPEGTRSLATKWKRGFYFIALKAGLPIQLYAIDYKRKRIVCTQELVPSGDVEADMRLIMDYYRPYEGKYPGKFAVEDI
ncbi:MAG: 1-acyl-sn-glycerol-3-phosphate acyltransferase [Bacteroidales bacterium]|nr:1-acyl-sn-glycerol-3-phosphate acyltransferase [Bacteroidales bacterium]